MRWRWVLTAGLVIAVVCGHRTMLRALASFHILDEECATHDYLVLLNGEMTCLGAVERWQRGGLRRIVLIESYPERVVRFGIMPRRDLIVRSRLQAAGVPTEAVEIIRGQTRSPWDALRKLGAWLTAHPDARVLLMCYGLEGRGLSLIVHRELDPESAARVGIATVADGDFDKQFWWQSRAGCKTVFYAWANLIIAWWFGEMPADPRQWDPDEYTRSLRS